MLLRDGIFWTGFVQNRSWSALLANDNLEAINSYVAQKPRHSYIHEKRSRSGPCITEIVNFEMAARC